MKLIISDTEFWMAHFRFTSAEQFSGRVCYCTIHKGPCLNQTRPCDTPGAITCWTTCSRLDNFVRYTGRKIAFGRAINTLPRATRTALWAAYLTAMPPMRKNVIVKGAKYVGTVPRGKAPAATGVREGLLAVPAGVVPTAAAAAVAPTHAPLSQADGEG